MPVAVSRNFPLEVGRASPTSKGGDAFTGRDVRIGRLTDHEAVMGKLVSFALTLLISTEAIAQPGDRYAFHTGTAELSNRVWSLHGVAVDRQQNRTWWCVYYVNVETIVTKLECLRRSDPSPDLVPSWIPLARRNAYPPKVDWSISSDSGVLQACISFTKTSCKSVQLGPFPRLLETVSPTTINR
jgi:hypothetical protein